MYFITHKKMFIIFYNFDDDNHLCEYKYVKTVFIYEKNCVVNMSSAGIGCCHVVITFWRRPKRDELIK